MRVSDELWEQAKERAAQRQESVSAVIVAALEAYVVADDAVPT